VTEPRAYDEKRDFIRMKVSTPITIQADGETVEGLCRNLSGSGLLVEAAQRLEPGSRAEVHITPGDSHSDFRASATVNRVEPVEGGYRMGLAIDTIHD